MLSELMCITDLVGISVGISNDFAFKRLVIEDVSGSYYITMGFSSPLSGKSIAVLYNCDKAVTVYQKVIADVSSSALSPSKLVDESNELMKNWA